MSELLDLELSGAFLMEWATRGLVESSALVLAACAAGRMAVLPARLRAGLWVLVAARLWVPPVLAWSAPPLALFLGSSPAPAGPAGPAWLGWLGAVWLAVSLTLGMGLVRHSRGLRAAVRRGTEAPSADLHARFRSLAAELGLRKLPELRVALRPGVGAEAAAASAWAAGVLRPVVVLRSGLDPIATEAALRHELHHHRRRDPLAQLFFEITHAVWWFHPLLWIAKARAHVAREIACDASVMDDWAEGRAHYAATLMGEAARRLRVAEARLPLCTEWLGQPATIVQRLRALEVRGESAAGGRSADGGRLVLLGAGLLVVALGLTRAAPSVAQDLPRWWTDPDAALREVEHWRTPRPGLGCTTGRLIYMRAAALQQQRQTP